MQNITQLYFKNKKEVPFVVRRRNWPKAYGLLVTSVHPKKTKNGWFGYIQGFGLPPLNERSPKDYWGLPGEPQEVPNAGSYQWELVSDIPWEWQQWKNEQKTTSI